MSFVKFSFGEAGSGSCGLAKEHFTSFGNTWQHPIRNTEAFENEFQIDLQKGLTAILEQSKTSSQIKIKSDDILKSAALRMSSS